MPLPTPPSPPYSLWLIIGVLLLVVIWDRVYASCEREVGYLEVGVLPHEIPKPKGTKGGGAKTSGKDTSHAATSPASHGNLNGGGEKGPQPTLPPAAYAQPSSKQHVWFDIKKLGGFREVPLLGGPPLIPTPGSPQGERWIVVTSINPPTPTIEKLAALEGWHVVLIGDTKTPKDWAYPGVTYLNVEAQLALGFSTTQLLHTRSYTRKNVGYLYAILHGARVIYETDDDNALQVSDIPIVSATTTITTLSNSSPSTPEGTRNTAYMLEYTSSSLTINHHAHFSQPSTWPRGYPLESIGDPHETSLHRATIIPAVQQGLANGDPDMDAIFRLTRKPMDRRVDFNFAQSEPIALPMGSFGPYNAQNTVFLYEGLWATLLPQTVEFRVCDIWRAYFTQRLLWGIGAQLSFVAPYVYQLRNSHSYHDDYISEKQIFDQVGGLLHFLKAWKCGKEDRALPFASTASPPHSLLPSCAYALARDMAIEGFWGPADAELIRHFFHDLHRVGYVFPAWLEPVEEGSYPSEDALEEGGEMAWVSPCSAASKGGAEPCKGPSESFHEAIDYSLPSIELKGTCPNLQ